MSNFAVPRPYVKPSLRLRGSVLRGTRPRLISRQVNNFPGLKNNRIVPGPPEQQERVTECALLAETIYYFKVYDASKHSVTKYSYITHTFNKQYFSPHYAAADTITTTVLAEPRQS